MQRQRCETNDNNLILSSEGEGEEGEGGEGEEEDDDEGESKIPAIELGLQELKAIQNALEKEKKEGGVSWWRMTL